MSPLTRLAMRVPFFYGWMIVLAAGVTMVGVATFTVAVLSVFVAPLTEEFGWSRTAISGGVTLGTVFAAAMGPFIGRWVDRYGSRVPLGIGGMLAGATLVAMGFIQNLAMFYVLFPIGRTIMMGVENLVGPTAVANWFVRRRALATAVVILGSRAGIGLWPAIAAALFVVGGWRLAFWVLGGLVFALGILPWLLVVSRRPEEVGLVPDGEPRRPRGTVEPFNPGAVTVERQWTPHEAVRTRAFWLLMLAAMSAAFAGGGVGFHRLPYFQDKGLADGLVGPLFFAYAIGMAVGGLITAQASTRISARKVLSSALLIGGLMMGVLLQVPGNGWAVLYWVGEGAVFGGVFTLLPVVYADYFGRESLGTIRGLQHPGIIGINALGPLVAGVVYDGFGQQYTYAFLGFGALFILGAVAAWMARPPVARDPDAPGVGPIQDVDTGKRQPHTSPQPTVGD